MKDGHLGVDKTYDVIIAGAGPAGCVLASRLSERMARTVLLIEAGPDAAPGFEHRDVLDPFPLSSNNPLFHWPGLTAEMGADPGDGTARVTRSYTKGFGVGGGSSVNGMGADRGLPADYDEWRDLGAENWGWSNVLPYFERLERDLDFSGPNARLAHGDGGPMPVRRLPRSRWAPFTATIADVLQRRGYPCLDDYMTDFREGFAGAPTNSLPHGRVSASMAYLTGAVRRRPNLTILGNSRVDLIVVEGRRARGVLVHRNSETTLLRGREVIISCGAIQSPALLMRSGIGPGGHLARHCIEVVRDMRGVGTNLQNHPCISLTMYLPPTSFQPPDNPWFLQNWLRYCSHYPGCGQTDMHLIPFNRTAWHALGSRVGMMVVTVLQSYSKGSVSLASGSPAVPPKVSFNLLADSRDYERLVGGFRFMLELLVEPTVTEMRGQIFHARADIVSSLARRNPWNSLKAHVIAQMLDISALRRMLLKNSEIRSEILLGDERALREFVRRHAGPQFHDCGTCRMGRKDDENAVVDGTGRVHGMEALRVVDASIFPSIPRGYPHFIVLMTAEKIADAIACESESSDR
jgi:5-(hydroxymethyl)furfural/furfural oxidase